MSRAKIKPMKRILIANRGEIAVRIIHTLREMGLTAVAIYSDIDQHAQHVTMADEAWPLGGQSSQESYLDIDKIIAIAKKAKIDAIHPGYGFLSENADFAQACLDTGIKFIGPSPQVITLMGDKIQAKAVAEKAGVPVVPGWRGESEKMSDKDWLKTAKNIGYPLLIKASAGGGGKGMRLVEKEADLLNAIEAAGREADKAFGDKRVFIEKYLIEPRHIEVQIIGDSFGNVAHLYERDCSAQRRHQKIIEEAPAPNLPEALRKDITDAAVRLAKAVHYENAGTVEFILDAEQNYYFLEMNTRLQVEHPITEWITGINLVREQIRIARGDKLSFSQDDITPKGHAIEARIYAEDPDNQFFPSTGILQKYQAPHKPWVRLDTGVIEGDEVSIYYDPMLAKLSVWADIREHAIQRLTEALKAFVVLGVKTNIAFLIQTLQSDDFKKGKVDTAILKRIPEQANASPQDLLPALAIATSSLRNKKSSSKQTSSTHTNYSPWNVFSK